MPADTSVAITGMGAVSSLGCGVDVFWRRLRAGETGLAPITLLSTAELRNSLGGEASGFETPPGRDRAAAMALAACREALAAAGLSGGKVGLVLSTNFGAASSWGLPGLDWGPEEFWPRELSLSLSSDLGLSGPVLVLSDSCSSGAEALAMARELVLSGREAVLACGFDALSLFALAGLSALRTITTETIRPFDKRRSGTLFGEGAGALLLEAPSAASRRGATIQGLLVGAAVNNNAHHLTAPSTAGMTEALRAAMEDAGTDPGEIGYVNAHGTGTPPFDKAETEALKQVLGQAVYGIPVSSIKAALGHAMGAAGALEAIATILALRDGWLPPTLNLEEPDPDCDLDYVPLRGRPCNAGAALSLSSGIGGNNAVLVLRRGEAAL